MRSYVPLHVHSQYSILSATASVSALVEKAVRYQMPALALTDSGNLYGAVDFFKACKKSGIQALIGCDFYVAPESRFSKKKEYGVPTHTRLTLIAKNEIGYRNLCKLSSAGFLEGFYFNPRIDEELLAAHAEGLICLSGGVSGKLAHALLNRGQDEVQQVIDRYQKLFGDDYYFELQRHEMSEEALRQDGFMQETWRLQMYRDYMQRQQKVNGALITLGKEAGVSLIATGDCYYLERDDWKAHEILLNVQSGEPCEIWEKDSMGNLKMRVPNPKRRTFPSHEYDFKSPDEMAERFADIPEALANTMQIAKKCSLELDFKAKHYPAFTPPSIRNKPFTEEERKEAACSYLHALCREGIKKRYSEEKLQKVAEVYPGKDPLEVVEDRLETEMSIIAPKGMCDYLLIVWDFIQWAKSRNIPVGPGRGSGAGSIVLYLIGVTDIEPLRFNLFFERFINPERLSYPDIDVDICMDRRQEVINYTLQAYGKDNVAQIITFGTMKAKMSIKDVGRVLNVPLVKVNAIAKLVPDDLNITLDKALEVDPDLRAMYEQDEETRRVLDIGRKLEGSIRGTGIHAAGLIISQTPLTDLIPICQAKDSDIPATQYSMKPVEQVGMLKIDFLGLKTLTAIKACVDGIKKAGGPLIDWINLSLEDRQTFDLLNRGKTMGVFQLESGGMQDLARHLHLDRFEEIIAAGALYRPGPMDMIPSFINRKHGREPIEYDHEWMKEILSETYGIMVYQEQVMQIASKLAGYSLGEGDVLRRAMGKKDREQMLEQREKFRLGALKNGIGDEVSMKIFDKMEKFASYGFNKSHAAAYGYLSYVTAYLKANYPKEWMAALMTCDSSDIAKVSKFIREAATMDITMLPPDINEAEAAFAAVPEGIRFAMSAIRGVGSGVVEAVVEEREKRGSYKSLYDFIRRSSPKKVGKKVIEHLVDAGCFDSTGWSRDQLRVSIDPMFEAASKGRSDRQAGVISLFSLMGEEEGDRFKHPPEIRYPRALEQMLLKEKELLGFFLTGHPMDRYADKLQRLSCIPLRKMESLSSPSVFRGAVIVESVQVRVAAKSQRKFAILTVGDGMVSCELPIWPELYEQKSQLLSENRLLYCVLHYEREDDAPKLNCRWLDDLTKADEQMIAECDAAYDKAKMMLSRSSYSKKGSGKKQEPKKEEKKEMSPCKISLCADTARLSDILKLRTLFEDNRGQTPVEVSFCSEKKELATLEIEATWGITPTRQLKNQLQEIEAVTNIDFS